MSRLLALAIVAIALLSAARGTPADANASACKDVMFIGARGSGEPDEITKNGKRVPFEHGMGTPVNYMAGRLAAAVAAYGETMGRLPVIYSADSVSELVPDKAELVAMAGAGGIGLGNPAAGVAGLTGAAALYYARHAKPYLASIKQGVNQTIKEIETQLQFCPESEVVLAGYSQGAMAIHQAELQLQRQGKDELLDAIGGTLLLGDGDRVSHTAAKLIGGAPSGGEGVQVALHGIKAEDVFEPETTVEICVANDVVCDFKLRADVGALESYRSGSRLHSNYKNPPQRTYLDQAVDWLAHEMGLDPLSRLTTAARAHTDLPTLNDGADFAIRPATFSGWAGDGSVVLGGPTAEPPLPNQAGGSYGQITWTVWNQRRAVGHGVVWSNDCQPSCGFGHWHAEQPTRVSAYRVRNGHFTRFTAKVAFDGYRHRTVFRYTNPYPPQWTR